MNDFQKVLVVDSGERFVEDAFSVQLAELGFSSVTTSFEAAQEVLDMIQTPSAIVVKVPTPTSGEAYDSLMAVAASLKGRERAMGVPVILWDRARSLEAGGLTGALSTAFGPQALSEPDA